MHQLNGHMYVCCRLTPRSLWDTDLVKSSFYIKYLISIVCQIKIDIEHLEVYVHKKNGLEDPFFRRLKLIIWTILMKSKLLIYILGTLKHVCWDIVSHQCQ